MTELEQRVANRKHELILQIIEHKKNCSRFGAQDEIARIQELLTDLKVLVPPNWASVEPKAKQRLSEWIKK